MSVGSKPKNDTFFNTGEAARNAAVRVMFKILNQGHGVEFTTPKRIVTKDGYEGVERKVGDKWVRLRQDPPGNCWDLETCGKKGKITLHFVVGERK